MPNIRAQRIPEHEWGRWKDIIHDAYIINDNSLEDVRHLMSREYGFAPSKSQWTLKLRNWRFVKHVADAKRHWKYVRRKIQQRESQGKLSEVLRHGEPVSPRTLTKELKRYNFESIFDKFMDGKSIDKRVELHSSPSSPNDGVIIVRTPRSLSTPLTECSPSAAVEHISLGQLEHLSFSIPLDWLSYCNMSWPTQGPHFEFQSLVLPDFPVVFGKDSLCEYGVRRPGRRILLSRSIFNPRSIHLAPRPSSGLPKLLFFTLLNLMPEKLSGDHMRTAEILAGGELNSAIRTLELITFAATNNLRYMKSTDEDFLNLLRQSSAGVSWLQSLRDSSSLQAQALFEAFFSSAIRCGDEVMSALLLRAGADPSQSISVENFNSLHRLLEKHIDISHTSRNVRWMMLPLQLALALHNFQLVKVLLHHGATYPSATSSRAESSWLVCPMAAVVLGNQLHNCDELHICQVLHNDHELHNDDQLHNGQELRACQALYTCQDSDERFLSSILSSYSPPNGEILEALNLARLTGDGEAIRRLLDQLFRQTPDSAVSPTAFVYAVMTDMTELIRLVRGTVCLSGIEDSLGWSPLIELIKPVGACRGENILSKVKLMLDHGANPNTSGNYKTLPPLIYAVQKKQEDFVDLLLKYGADPNVRSGYKSPLSVAIHHQCPNIVNVLLEKGAQPTKYDVVQPIRAGYVDKLQMILTRLGSYSACMDNFRFHHSPAEAQVAEKLLEYHPTLYDPSLLLAVLATPLQAPTASSPFRWTSPDRVTTLRAFLTRRRREPRSLCCHEGAALAFALWNGDAAMVTLLLDQGIHLSQVFWIPHSRLKTPSWPYNLSLQGKPVMTLPRLPSNSVEGAGKLLQLAISHGHGRLRQYLLDCGVNPNSGDTRSCLEAACSYAELDVVQELLDHGAEVRERPRPHPPYRTAFQVAVESANLEIVELLLARGADINEAPAEPNGATALQLAAIKGHLGIARRLIGLGANCNAPAALSYGRTALEGAAEHGRLEMINLLLREGTLTEGPYRRQYIRAIKFASLNGHNVVAKLLRSSRPWIKVDGEVFFAEDISNSSRHSESIETYEAKRRCPPSCSCLGRSTYHADGTVTHGGGNHSGSYYE